MTQFDENRFGLVQIPKFIEMRRSVINRFQMPSNSNHDTMKPLLSMLSRCSRVTPEQTRTLNTILSIDKFVIEATAKHIDAILSADESHQLKPLLMLTSGSTTAQVHAAYDALLVLLGNSDTILDRDKVDKVTTRLRKAFGEWETNRLEAERRRAKEQEAIFKRKENESRQAEDQQKRNREAIQFILNIQENVSKLSRDPFHPSDPSPFYYLGFHPSRIPGKQDLRAKVKQCRKVLSRLTHPDKLQTDDESQKQRANEAFRLTGLAVNHALELVDANLESVLATPLQYFTTGPWLNLLGIDPHDGEPPRKMARKAPVRKRKR
eukprot:GHVH01005332.1.p1 GENE.GHVH01005332.1~~GHVH01005332.1.p1  ORF type:complete len:322 (+),score=45.16 GHVH01005332.1:474-1439(+)